MIPPMRIAGAPSPLADGTHDDADLTPAIPYKGGGASEGHPLSGDPFDIGRSAPPWLATLARLIRPLSIGALMAIPTVGSATVGVVAMIDPIKSMAMVAASTAFLRGIPIEIIVLIGTLATGYGFAKTIERLKGVRL